MMPRIVARLDVKKDRVVKGVSMQGERGVGDPHAIAVARYAEGADELLFVDTYASLIGRNSLGSAISRVADDVFVPLSVAGGIRSVEDVRDALMAGADRVGLNTAAVNDPDLPKRLCDTYGASTIFLMLDAVKREQGWEALTEYGREPSGLDAVEWAHRMGFVGEVVVTSVDRDGRMDGPDSALCEALSSLPCPVTYGGGVRDAGDCHEVLSHTDAVAIGAALHFGHTTIESIKDGLASLGRRIRR